MTTALVAQINHAEIMAEARASLQNIWHRLALYTLGLIVLLTAISNFIPPIASSIASLIVSGPINLGVASLFFKASNNEAVSFGDYFKGFQNFLNAFLVGLITGLIVGVGIMLLIIPGIIAALGLSQVYFIMADKPETDPIEAIKESWELMKGHKWDYFVLGLRFLPWALLCILTAGIGLLWLSPYISTTYANYYKKLAGRENSRQQDIIDHLVG